MGSGADFDEAMIILTAVKEALTEKIKLAAIIEETTEIISVETTTHLESISEVVDTGIVPTEYIEEATAEPEPPTEAEEEATAEPEPISEPEPSSQPELEADYKAEVEDFNEAEIAEPVSSDTVLSEQPNLLLEAKNIILKGNEKELESLYFEDINDENLNDEIGSERDLVPIIVNEVFIHNNNEEGSGYFNSESDNLEVIDDNHNVLVEVSNHGVNGVTELPGRSKSATPGVDFGLIQEITNN